MFSKIAKAFGFALLITLFYLIASDAGYYYINGESMFVNIHYFSWVPYAIGAILMLVAVLILELIRAFVGKK